MSKQADHIAGHNRLVRHPLAVGTMAALLLAGCSLFGSNPEGSSASTDGSSKAPRLVKKESGVVWDNPSLFGPVAADLQARGNEACNAGSAKKMKAVGYHPQAVRLDGSVFPRGGFLCAADDAPAVAAAPAKTADRVAVKPVAQNLSELTSRTQNWAKAWAAKDLNAYFAFYSESFKPAGFANLKAWKDARTARINKSGAISVEVSGVSTKALSGGAAETQFTQRYDSANFKDTSTKTLVWANESGVWKIISESNR